MKTCLSICFVITMILSFVSTGFAGNDSQLVEPMGNGSINWTKGVVRAVGIGAPPDNAYGKPQARPLALTAARMVAYRNLLEVVQGVRIQSKTLVKNFMVEDDSISAHVSGMIRGAQVVKKEYMSDGTVEVTVEMSLKGGFAQLILPQDIKQVEAIKANTPEPASGFDKEIKEDSYTGLVVDARGLNAKPAMSPKILDEKGQEVYGSAYVSREYAVQQGMSGYSKDLNKARLDARVTDKPLVVKALKTQGDGHSDIVISSADASRLNSVSENLGFLKKCRVMIVVD